MVSYKINAGKVFVQGIIASVISVYNPQWRLDDS